MGELKGESDEAEEGESAASDLIIESFLKNPNKPTISDFKAGALGKLTKTLVINWAFCGEAQTIISPPHNSV